MWCAFAMFMATVHFVSLAAQTAILKKKMAVWAARLAFCYQSSVLLIVFIETCYSYRIAYGFMLDWCFIYTVYIAYSYAFIA